MINPLIPTWKATTQDYLFIPRNQDMAKSRQRIFVSLCDYPTNNKKPAVFKGMNDVTGNPFPNGIK